MTLADYNKKKEKIPDTPGVYFFLGPKKELLYIGKATSLRDRLRSYFSPDLMETRGPLLVEMLAQAASIDWRQTDSVLEALILEAQLIKTHKPKHNTMSKDDKSFNYVVITREDFPRLLLVRGKDLSRSNESGILSEKLKAKSTKLKAFRAVFGPFPHGMQLKDALKIIRKIFPYRDKCEPCVAGKRCKPCFNRQIGLCPGVCSGEIGKREYARTIRHLILFFEGKKKALLRALTAEMKAAAKAEKFEEAARLRRQLFSLQHIQDVSLIKSEYRVPASGGHTDSGRYRVEAYDVAHWGGEAAIGVMTVVENGVARTAEYRTFKIREASAGDDVGALREILSRRLAHNEWQMPRLIVVDGSRAQINAAQIVLRELEMKSPVVGVVKNEKHQPRGISGDKDTIRAREQDILLANAEAHRFAIGKHRRARRVV